MNKTYIFNSLQASYRYAAQFSNTCFKHGSHSISYLLAVALSLLPDANGVKCRNELGWAVGKVLTASDGWLMDRQRIWILKDWVAVKKISNGLDFKTEYISLWTWLWPRDAEDIAASWSQQSVKFRSFVRNLEAILGQNQELIEAIRNYFNHISTL